MKLKELVRRKPITIGVNATVYDVVKIMAEQNIGFILVMEDSSMVGVLSERDVIKALAERKDLNLKVVELCRRDVITLPAEASLEEAAEKMGKHWIRHVVVLDEKGGVYGVVSVRDLIQELYCSGSETD